MSLCIALPAILLSANGCKKHHDRPPGPEVEDIKIRIYTSPTLGSYLADSSGHALYMFANDANGLNNCAGPCELVWPYFLEDSLNNDNLGDTSLHLSDFKTIVAANGKKQTTYKGWPLYYYAPAVGGSANTPEAAGATTGEGVGGVWFVAKPDYTIMLANFQLMGNNGKLYKSDYTEGTGRTVYFTDGKGVTLYAFANDRLNKNNFTRSDFSNNGSWPINENLTVVAPSVLDKTLFGSIDVFTRKQLTYKGRPIYYFGLDSMMRGSNKGVSVGSVPGTWPVVVKDIAPATP